MLSTISELQSTEFIAIYIYFSPPPPAYPLLEGSGVVVLGMVIKK